MLAALVLAAWPQEPAAPRALGWEDFPVFVWRETHKGKPLPPELAEPFGGVILMRDESSAWARERGLAHMVWNVAGRDALHLDADEAWNTRVERWIETRDQGLLLRTPCLNDPAVVASLFATLETTLVRHGDHPGLGLVLGDEVSLTPNGDPFDLCRCGVCEAKWTKYAREHGFPERAPLTDEVLEQLRDGETELVGPWLARRRFEQEYVQELLLSLAEKARSGRKVEIGLLGLKGRTAFGGVDLAALWQKFDVLEAYDVGEAMALGETLRNRRWSGPLRARHTAHEASLTTLFLDGESPDGAAWLAWEAWLAGADGLVLWSDRALAGSPELRKRLGEALADIRSLSRRFETRARGARRRLAVLSDGDATALAWLNDALDDGQSWPRRRAGYQETHGSRERRLRAWREACRDIGEDLGAVPLAGLASESNKFDTLVLVDQRVLDPADVVALERFLEGGGRILVDGETATLDRRGRPWKESQLTNLEARHPGKVRRLEEDSLRVARGETRAEFRRRLRALLDEVRRWDTVGYELRGPTAERSWFHRRSAAHTFTCAFGAEYEPELVRLLPEARTAKERRELKGLELDLAPSGAELEWVHPREGRELRPGDAAVFLLHPKLPEPPR